MRILSFLICLFTVNLNRHFRAYRGAQSAPVTFFCLINAHRMVAQGIVFICRDNMAFRTEMDAQQTFLAHFLVNFNVSLQNKSSQKNNRRKLSCA